MADDGVGLSPENSARIFGLFERSREARSVQGAGLGLAIVREAAERHGGRIWLETGPAGGTTFHFTVAKNL